MDVPEPALQALNDDRLCDELIALRRDIAAAAEPLLAEWGRDARDASLANLAHYLALRHHDIRPLQRQLMWHGLSSLGRLESRVLPALDATLAALTGISGRPAPFAPVSEAAFFSGEARLDAATDALFGPQNPQRRTRIMVTLPSEAATDSSLTLAYARLGMDLARINCAHDNGEVWRRMAANARAAGEAVGRPVRVLMDIAGPKVRTATVIAPPKAKLFAGDSFRLVTNLPTAPDGQIAATISFPEILARLAVGDRILYDDGKIEGTIESIDGTAATVRVARTKSGGSRFKTQKGLNLPDTPLGLAPLTAKDEEDIAAAIESADMIGYSFVSQPEDIDLFETVLARHGDRPGLGLVAKVERPEAVSNLPALIARATARRPFGIMIARGDLAAEIGYTRLAEMQEEILWLCEAAAVPSIWATQVLEGLVQAGTASRGEMTDAAMGARAECVMLNKGEGLATAIEVLDRLLCRMDDHLFKKTPMLRALKSW